MEFFGTARQISGQIYDEPTYDSAIAYVLLTCICMLNNDKRAVHYAHLGRSHSKEVRLEGEGEREVEQEREAGRRGERTRGTWRI